MKKGRREISTMKKKKTNNRNTSREQQQPRRSVEQECHRWAKWTLRIHFVAPSRPRRQTPEEPERSFAKKVNPT